MKSKTLLNGKFIFACAVMTAVAGMLPTQGVAQSAVPPYHSLFGQQDVSGLGAIGDQKQTNECVAWAVSSAVAANIIRNWYTVNTGNAPPIEELSVRQFRLLNAGKFFRDAGGNANTGWQLVSAVPQATRITIPFNHDPRYGARISVSGFQRLDNNPNTVDEMRREISLDRPVLASMLTYPSFNNFKGYVYQGPNQGEANSGGHSMLVVGYNTGARGGASGGAFWECMNSWGKQWGTHGFFRVRTGACNIGTRQVYAVRNVYICDLQGNKVSQAKANEIIEAAINAIPSVTNAVHKNVMFNNINRGKLPDGDQIRVSSAPSRNPNSSDVSIKLVLPRGMWWKGALLFDKARESNPTGVQGEGGGNGFSRTYTFKHADLLKKDLVLSKAKAFGVHTNMYRIKDAYTKMIPGRTYTFNWSKD
ncbi:C1 family peptidase [Gimesia alba]|nr:C1 family peptidase [Gimesia alba]